MSRWIPASELRETDVLVFQAEAVTPTGDVKIFDGIPIDKLTRLSRGRVKVRVTYIDGTRRYKTFAAHELVMVR
jgi:hypothetical protein